MFSGVRRFGLVLVRGRGRAVSLAAVVVVPASVAISAVAFAASGGGGWSIQHTPNIGPLASVSCSSPRACTAVGGSAAERWNGTKWHIQRVPRPGLDAVSCTARNACTAVGEYFNKRDEGFTLAERWNGSKWHIQHTPNPANANSGLFGVSCTSRNACTAVGAYDHTPGGSPEATLAERWNGSKWHIQHTPNLATNNFGSILSGVSCSSQSACIAVGRHDPKTGGRKGFLLAERWNGSKWSLQHIPNPSRTSDFYATGLNAVSCPSTSSCTAVGNYITSVPGEFLALAEHWNGSKWSRQHIPNPTTDGNDLFGVSCRFKSACTVVGDYYNNITYYDTQKPLPLAERWNGTKWYIQHVPRPTHRKGVGLNAVSCTFKSNCTAVGSYLNFNSGAVSTLAEHLSGG